MAIGAVLHEHKRKSPRIEIQMQIKMNYEKCTDTLVHEAGFDWHNSQVNSRNFPLYQRNDSLISVSILHFGCAILSQEAEHEFARLSLRSLEVAELLTLAKFFPDLQRKFKIAGLGSIWNEYCPVLMGNEHRRSLSLDLTNIPWSSILYFAVTKNQLQ